MKDSIKKKLVKVVPIILVGVMASSSIFLSYDKGNEVKAVAGVDDIMVVTAILALCGVTFLGTEELWGDGNGWYPGIDAGQDVDEWIDDFNKPWKEEWDEKTKEYALEHGLIDENGNYTGGGSGGDDDDHKFPSWEKIKTLVKANGGNVATALGAYLPLLTGFAQSVLYDSGVSLADKLLDDGYNFNETYVDKYTFGYGRPPRADWSAGNIYGIDNVIFKSKVPVCYYLSNGKPIVLSIHNSGSSYGRSMDCFADGKFLGTYEGFAGYLSSDDGYSINGKVYDIWIESGDDFMTKYQLFCPKFDTREECKNYLKKRIKENTPNYINPTSIGESSNLKDKKTTGVDGMPVLPTFPINDYVKLPTADDLKDFFKKIGIDKDDKDKKQKDIDDFIKKLTTKDTSGGETPKPDPTPTPDPEPDPGGGSGGGGSTDTPGKDDDSGEDAKKDYARDLQKIFPFCIPFDIVDCFRLFNAEPETPRVEIPLHFGIVDKDYTFVIDLKDFDNVALILRSTLLISFVVGLGLATRNLIKW